MKSHCRLACDGPSPPTFDLSTEGGDDGDLVGESDFESATDETELSLRVSDGGANGLSGNGGGNDPVGESKAKGMSRDCAREFP